MRKTFLISSKHFLILRKVWGKKAFFWLTKIIFPENLPFEEIVYNEFKLTQTRAERPNQ